MNDLDPVEDQNVELRVHLQQLLVEYQAFMQTSAFRHYVKMRERESDGIKMDIITIDPIDRAAEIESFKMRGDLRTTDEFKTLFEDTTASLVDQIEQLLQLEQPSGEQTSNI